MGCNESKSNKVGNTENEDDITPKIYHSTKLELSNVSTPLSQKKSGMYILQENIYFVSEIPYFFTEALNFTYFCG